MNRPTAARQQPFPRRTAIWWLLAIVTLGTVLRWHGLRQHFFWFDEGLLLDVDQLHNSFVHYVGNVWRTTTYNPGWAAVVWLASRLGGPSLLAARVPSFLAGVLNIAVIFTTARALRLDRTTALAAALLTALAWPQIEYSQQVMPYACIPLLTSLLVWALAGLGGRKRERMPRARKAPSITRPPHFLVRRPVRRMSAKPHLSVHSELSAAHRLGDAQTGASSRLDPSPELHPDIEPRANVAPAASDRPRDRTRRGALALAVVGTLAVINHNSILMLLPFLGLVAAGSIIRRNMPADDRRRLFVVGASLAWVALVAVVFYLPKRGEGYRTYLDPYYLPTFVCGLDTIDIPTVREQRLNYAPFLDRTFHHIDPHPSAPVASLFFVLTRTYDIFLYSVNLFCPAYVTPAWGLASAIPVGLALAGLVATLRGRRGPVLRLIGIALAGTLLLLLLLSTALLYPFGGIRQLLFLSPIILIMAAIGWRVTLRRWPRATWTLSALVILIYALRLPAYEDATKARLDESAVLAAIRATGIRTFVVAEFGEHYFVFNQMLRKVPNHELINAPWPRCGTLLYRREPLLLFSDVSLAPGDFQGRNVRKSAAYHHLLCGNPDFSAYEVTPLLAHPGGPFRGGQPNPGAFLYRLRPRPGLPPVAYRPLVQSVTPANDTRWTAGSLTAIEVAFSSAIDARKLHPAAIELMVKSDGNPGAPPFAPVPAAVAFDDSARRCTLRPRSPLAPGVYLIKLDETVEDRDGFRRESPFYATFEVAPSNGVHSVATGDSQMIK